jgi:GMP synthase-like glutamine amidotransferase
MFDAISNKTESEGLPFPYNKRTFCRYEPIEQKVTHAKVLIVNNLLRYESDLSPLARQEWNGTTASRLKLENKISAMACNNIAKNILRLVKHPKTRTVHLSEVQNAVDLYNPDAIVMSGTLTDFDYYNPDHLEKFAGFIKSTRIPVLAICGAHQLVGMAFGADLRTLDDHAPAEKREQRLIEYQYRFVKIVDTSDPIFEGVANSESSVWQDYTVEDDKLRVWQNHGLKVKGVPEGFKLLATSYLCKNQMMVKNTGGQMIYAVQFHLEKSFEEWSKNPTRWEHHNESRDGRILFENFLKLALRHKMGMNAQRSKS